VLATEALRPGAISERVPPNRKRPISLVKPGALPGPAGSHGLPAGHRCRSDPADRAAAAGWCSVAGPTLLQLRPMKNLAEGWTEKIQNVTGGLERGGAAARRFPCRDSLRRNLKLGFHPTPGVVKHGRTLPIHRCREHLTAG